MKRNKPQSQPTRQRDGYRFDHLTTSMILQDMRFSRDSLKPGERFPDQSLLDVQGREVRLSDYGRGRPVVLVTGSVSCPVTISSLPTLRELNDQYGDRLAFVLVYAREALPGERIGQPGTMEEKIENAKILQAANGVHWPVLVDDIDGTVHRMLDTKPNSLHVISPDGALIFRALFATDSNVEEVLESVANGEVPGRSQSTQFVLPVMKSAGYIHDVLVASGRGAYLDVLLAAPPAAIMGLVAKAFQKIFRKRSATLPATN